MNSKSHAKNIPIGIDLGTTNSLVACWLDSRAQLIPNSAGSFLTPSAVSLGDDGAVLIGMAAWERRLTHPQRTATAFKRHMGSRTLTRLGNRDFLPEELSALVLTSLKNDAQAFLGNEVSDVVISVPAYFNDTQRKATKAAAQIAGLNVLRLINEPTAASLAFGLQEAPEDSAYLVFDLGGGTFDVSIVDQFDGVIEIKASTGDNYLGGEDFTALLSAQLSKQIDLPQLANNAEQTTESIMLQARLNGIADRFKVELSETQEVNAVFQVDAKSFPLKYSAHEFETVCQPLVDRLKTPIERAIRDARLDPSALSEIVLVGGATRMPLVRKLVTRLFGRFPNTKVHPDQAIALGAATQAALVGRDAALDEVLLTDVCPYSLGVAVSEPGPGGQIIHGVFSPIIERNTLVPVSRVRQYNPANDHQSEVVLQIYQGERRFCKDNILLGELHVKLPVAKRENSNIDVRFSYDVSGLLEVDATITSTGERFNLSLMGSGSALAPEEIEARRAALRAIQIHPREDLPNRAVCARADRLYAELIGAQREAVGSALTQFTFVLERQDPIEIQRARVEFEKWLDALEQGL